MRSMVEGASSSAVDGFRPHHRLRRSHSPVNGED